MDSSPSYAEVPSHQDGGNGSANNGGPLAAAAVAAMRDDFPPPSNPFAFSPAQLHQLLTLRSLAVLDAIGGLLGLATGLRTDPDAGLSSDETTLQGNVTLNEALAAGLEGRRSGLPPTEVPSQTPNLNSMHHVHALRIGEPVDTHFTDRKRIFGTNQLPRRHRKSFLKLMWIAFNDKLLMLLTISASVSLAIGIYQSVSTQVDASNIEWVDGLTVVAAIVVIVLASAANDWQQSHKFEKLNERKQQRDVTVVRSARAQKICIHDVLVGDVMHIEAGEVIAVDGVLIQAFGLHIDESSVSGEAELVHKTVPSDHDPSHASLADPFILSGTAVSRGVGRYLVISVGANSTYGRTLISLREDIQETPLQVKLGRLGKQLIIVGAVVGSIFFIILFIRYLLSLEKLQNKGPSGKAEAFFDILILAITVVVIIVPEGLALNVCVALAFAAKRMLKDNNLVRLIRSCEIMGNATCICSDKTGTLTQNKMTVVAGRIGLDGRFDDMGQEAAAAAATAIAAATIATTPTAVIVTAASPAPAPTSLIAAAGSTATVASTRGRPALNLGLDSAEIIHRSAFPAPPRSGQLAASLSEEVRELVKESMAVNSTAIEGDESACSDFFGSSTETALLNFSRDHLGMGPLRVERANSPIVTMLPFESSRKWMAVLVKLPQGRYRLLVKGAAEVVFEFCAYAIGNPSYSLTANRLSEGDRESLRETIREYAGNMLRPVAIGYRDFDASEIFENPDDDPAAVNLEWLASGLVFIGFFGIRDPLRLEVIESVRRCQEAGVFVRMVTGDNFTTAKAIAAECGIYSAGGVAMDGPTFRKLSPSQLDSVIPRLQVLARSSPEDKLLLVSRLRAMKETVAVTGDGTNDALALKAADVGFAMGIQGTEVAKEAASIVLLDDNFASIVKALGWGRTVNDAVKKFCQFQFTINITAGTLTVVSKIVGDSIFTVVQLLWVNLIMDIFASLGLATDLPSPDFLERKPEPRNAPIVSVTMWKMIIGQAIYQLAVIFTVHYAGQEIFNPETQSEEERLQTLVFNIYVWMQFFNQHNCRRVDNKLDIWYQGVLRNPWFIGVQCLTLVGQFVIIFEGRKAFDTVPLTGVQWGWSILFGMLTIPLGALIRQVPDRYVSNMFGIVRRTFLSLTRPLRTCYSCIIRRRSRGRSAGRGRTEEGDEEMRTVDDMSSGTSGTLPGVASQRPADGTTGDGDHESAAAAAAKGQTAAEKIELVLDLQGMIDAAKTGTLAGEDVFELHPKTLKDDPIIGTRSNLSLPPSQDPALQRFMARADDGSNLRRRPDRRRRAT